MAWEEHANPVFANRKTKVSNRRSTHTSGARIGVWKDAQEMNGLPDARPKAKDDAREKGTKSVGQDSRGTSTSDSKIGLLTSKPPTQA